MRILNVAAGVLPIAAGIYCLRDQDVVALSAGFLLGMFLPLAGIAEIVVFAAASGVMLGSGWLLERLCPSALCAVLKAQCESRFLYFRSIEKDGKAYIMTSIKGKQKER